MKRFGYLRDYMHFNLYNTSKLIYAQHPLYGALELPKHPSGANGGNIRIQAQKYQQRLEFEKYLNPKGLKPTITSKFPQPQQRVDFANLMIYRVPTEKYYGPGVLCFRSPVGLSKPEVKQFLTKLYDLSILSIHSVRRPGKIMRTNEGKYWLKRETKKWIVKLNAVPQMKEKTEEQEEKEKYEEPKQIEAKPAAKARTRKSA